MGSFPQLRCAGQSVPAHLPNFWAAAYSSKVPTTPPYCEVTSSCLNPSCSQIGKASRKARALHRRGMESLSHWLSTRCFAVPRRHAYAEHSWATAVAHLFQLQDSLYDWHIVGKRQARHSLLGKDLKTMHLTPPVNFIDMCSEDFNHTGKGMRDSALAEQCELVNQTYTPSCSAVSMAKSTYGRC